MLIRTTKNPPCRRPKKLLPVETQVIFSSLWPHERIFRRLERSNDLVWSMVSIDLSVASAHLCHSGVDGLYTPALPTQLA